MKTNVLVVMKKSRMNGMKLDYDKVVRMTGKSLERR